jgi:hypothetical protein
MSKGISELSSLPFLRGKKILNDFNNLLNTNQPQHVLCGHNAKEFDIPFIARRMIINSIVIPNKLNLFGKKPWKFHLIPWNYGSLATTSITPFKINVQSAWNTISKVISTAVKSYVFYVDKVDIDRIAYCEKDTTFRFFLGLEGKIY